MKKFYDKCLKEGKIKLFNDAHKLVTKEIRSSENDFKEAYENLKLGKIKWATIQAYYSMFHAGRALLYFKGYREKSHSRIYFKS